MVIGPIGRRTVQSMHHKIILLVDFVTTDKYLRAFQVHAILFTQEESIDLSDKTPSTDVRFRWKVSCSTDVDGICNNEFILPTTVLCSVINTCYSIEDMAVQPISHFKRPSSCSRFYKVQFLFGSCFYSRDQFMN